LAGARSARADAPTPSVQLAPQELGPDVRPESKLRPDGAIVSRPLANCGACLSRLDGRADHEKGLEQRGWQVRARQRGHGEALGESAVGLPPSKRRLKRVRPDWKRRLSTAPPRPCQFPRDLGLPRSRHWS
jgi:hypothetical protein